MKNTPADQASRQAASCVGKDKLTATRAREVASRMSSRGKRVVPYKCDSCGNNHVGRPTARDQGTRKRLAQRAGSGE